MGELKVKVAAVVDRLRTLGFTEQADKLVADVKEAAKKMKLRKGSKKGVTWVCATKPYKGKDKKGRPVWVSVWKWKKGSKTGVMKRIVGSAKKPAPRAIMAKGKKLPLC